MFHNNPEMFSTFFMDIQNIQCYLQTDQVYGVDQNFDISSVTTSLKRFTHVSGFC